MANQEHRRRPLRLLVVDDTALYRKVVRDVLNDCEEVDVVGVAANGRIALERIDQLQPDVLTLDIEMPELDGLGVLRALGQRDRPPGAILLSAHSCEGAKATTQGLQLGAFDFVLKPTGSSPAECMEKLRSKLIPKLLAYAASALPAGQIDDQPAMGATIGRAVGTGSKPPISNRLKLPPRVIAIGVSTGGPAALGQLLPALPGDLGVPVLIVQHMPAVFTASLAQELNGKCNLEVREASHGERLRAGVVLFAPGGRHMRVAGCTVAPIVEVVDDPPELNCRPSVDYLFRSVADVFGAESLGLILTGMGNDGVAGCRMLKEKGATVLAQDEATSVVFGMPRRVVESQLADDVLPLGRLARRVLRSLNCSVAT